MSEHLEDAYKNMHLLPREERAQLSQDLIAYKPDFLKPFRPAWWWYRRCEVKVLLVTDGGLDFETGSFGLSEFITTFNKLNLQPFINVLYKVTVAHRGGVVPVNPNPVIVSRLANFNFDTSVTLNDYDQVWLFGINSGASLTPAEITRIDKYMSDGGGLFATGDHGDLGSALCSQIPRVADMRYWADYGGGELSMSGNRRNDTNRPAAGQTVSTQFNNQSDNIPQTIAVRTFGGGQPHPLLSISTAVRPSGIIDIMPDHPHEGEVRHEKVFTVTNPSTGVSYNISTQVISTSFVLSGSTAAGKLPTIPHCFPSISVFDGRIANIGRIVTDSTWHHFVNINLNGAGSGMSGLTTADFNVIQQYYMNIATWMTRRRNWWCWRRWIWVYLLSESQLIEASLNYPLQDVKDIKIADLYSIGVLARQIMSDQLTPGFADEMINEMIEPVAPDFVNEAHAWSPAPKRRGVEMANDWIYYDNITATAIGAGFIYLRDHFKNDLMNDELAESALDRMPEVFESGVKYGINLALSHLSKAIADFDQIDFSRSRK